MGNKKGRMPEGIRPVQQVLLYECQKLAKHIGAQVCTLLLYLCVPCFEFRRAYFTLHFALARNTFALALAFGNAVLVDP